MPLTRRAFLNLAATGIATALSAPAGLVHGAAGSKIRAIAFDAFPVCDLRSVFALAEQLSPGKGAALGNAWRTRQFE